MIEWTEKARRVLEEYCARSKTVLAGTGADADEVGDDLRRHVDEEVRAAGLTVVTEANVRRILARVGEPCGVVDEKSEKRQSTVASAAPQRAKGTPSGFFALLLGVILPLGTLIFELVTGSSAGILFDPLPSLFHVLVVAAVPGLNTWIWIAGRNADSRRAKLLGWLNGIVIGVCIFYSVLYLPFAPFALFGIIFFGAGLIPLAPYITLAATCVLRATYAERVEMPLPGGWRGTFVGLGLLCLLQLPIALTYYGLAQASSEGKGARAHGVAVLRTFGDRELMLRACYGLLRRELDVDLVRSISSGKRLISAEQAREVYYRVTGKPFNAVPPPSLYTRTGRWNVLDQELTWDDALGGEVVAGRVKGLSLLSSRMDAVAEPDAAVVYCEWTLEFKNISSQQREARAQISLPPGAVVSRLTLWINGEEREAAFGGRSQVREAYQEVAVVRRRDPVLVTTCGPDRVLMQCFPVPPSGGVMKIRIGMTAPLILESQAEGRFVWPRFLERNFAIGSELRHALWIQSPQQLTRDKQTLKPSLSGTRPFTSNESASDAELAGSPKTIMVHRAANVKAVWTPAEETGEIIRQTIQPMARNSPSRAVFVLDGSVGMQDYARETANAFPELAESTEIAVIIADDEPVTLLANPQKATPAVLRELGQRLRARSFKGGKDNLPALEVAWDLAAAVENGIVIWIHKPQPVLLSPESGLRQRIERSPVPPRVLEIQTTGGPDRIIEKLDGLASIEHLSRYSSLREELSKLFARLAGKIQGFEFLRERTANRGEVSLEPRVTKHIERLWARDETLRLAGKRNRDAATKLAAAHQLVTPVTGAVVLETMQQFARHGLTPAEATTVPSIPEPQPSALLLFGLLALALYQRMKRRRNAPQTVR